MTDGVLAHEDSELRRLLDTRDHMVVAHTQAVEQFAWSRQNLDAAAQALGAATEDLVAYRTRPRPTFASEEDDQSKDRG